MVFRQINNIFPLARMVKLMIILSLCLQFIIVFQIFFFRLDLFNAPLALLLRVARGTILFFFAGFILAYPFLFLIRYLNKKLPWKAKSFRRFFLQFPLTLLSGFIITPMLLLPAGMLFNLEHDLQTIIHNAYYLIVLSLFLMLILEAWIFFEERSAAIVGEELFKAKAQIEEEKNKTALQMLEQEKIMNHNLELEIGKREKIANELNENRELLQTMISNLVGAAYRCQHDENYTINYISEKIFEISGYPASDFKGNTRRSYASIIHPEDAACCQAKIMEAAKAKVPFEIEYRIIHSSGEIVWVNENGKCIFDNTGKVTFIDGIIIDITRRKNAELLANEIQRNYKDLMDFLPQPIFELNLEGRIMFSNRAGDEFFGKLPDDPQVKQSALSFFIKEDIPRIIENFKLSAQGIKTDPGEYTAIKADGSLCPVMVFGTPIIRDNKIVGRRGIIIDISERKKYELGLLDAKHELEKVNKNLEQMVARRTRDLTQANTKLLKVQKENLQSQFEVLKQQVNPHFLFNSLNVLTSLIKIDPDLAESFTERLSKVYRYVLENKDKDLVSLSTELEFLNSYLFLLEIRFMHKIFIEINIDKSYHDYQILPIAIQLIIENAIKHNTFSKLQPLRIEISVDPNNKLTIINTLNVRETKFPSTGVGLENISRRYALVSNQKPSFRKTQTQFIARLPLLKTEKLENKNHS